ncbi:hypothetical protein COHA_003373 [Chlorella ohadii]|uniref:Uncharacterized protein n=1 Tax=Chlorella ohadii TaxID=2649997 RepID=A0AAD5DV50_9CHLO|nr:hypothetical protein COHA_003373 [Chlorella ohadii]
MARTGALRALLQEAGSAVSSVFVDAGSASTAAASEAEQQQQHWSGTPKLGPSGATIGVVCAVVVVLLVIATLVHWLHRSGRLPCCNKLLDDTADDEPTFLQARHSLEVPPPNAEPPPVVVLMPDDEVSWSGCWVQRYAAHLAGSAQRFHSAAVQAAGPQAEAAVGQHPTTVLHTTVDPCAQPSHYS